MHTNIPTQLLNLRKHMHLPPQRAHTCLYVPRLLSIGGAENGRLSRGLLITLPFTLEKSVAGAIDTNCLILYRRRRAIYTRLLV